jgi:hypothetical protein
MRSGKKTPDPPEWFQSFEKKWACRETVTTRGPFCALGRTPFERDGGPVPDARVAMDHSLTAPKS